MWKNVTGRSCMSQWKKQFQLWKKEFLGFGDFLESWKDLFRNKCHREDIWELEDLLQEITETTFAVAEQCDNENKSIIENLFILYAETEVDLDMLRKFGDLKSTLKEKQAFLKPYEDEKILSTLESEKKVQTQYFQPVKYKDFDKKNNPDGCKGSSFDQLYERLVDLRDKLKSIKNGFKFTEEEMKESNDRAKAAAKKWLKNFGGSIDLGFIKMELVSESKDHKGLGTSSNLTKLVDNEYLLIAGKVDIAKHYGWDTLLKDIGELLSEEPRQISHKKLTDKIEAEEKWQDREKVLAKTRKKFLYLFSETGDEVARDLEWQLMALDACIQRAYIEKPSNKQGNLGCSLEKDESGTYFIDPGDHDVQQPYKYHALNKSFIDALKNLLEFQCANKSRCLVHPSIIDDASNAGTWLFNKVGVDNYR